MSLKEGQFSRSNFWAIFQKINFFKNKILQVFFGKKGSFNFVGVINKMKILAFFHQKFKFLCLEYDNVTLRNISDD